MDEAGLPEKEKESLKVLHFLLEGHMSTTAEVGFVGISNHVLDAAPLRHAASAGTRYVRDDEHCKRGPF
jgi:hypothetical protein